MRTPMPPYPIALPRCQQDEAAMQPGDRQAACDPTKGSIGVAPMMAISQQTESGGR